MYKRQDFDPDHIIASIKDSDVKLDYATANTYVRIMQAETYDYAQGVIDVYKRQCQDR